MTGGLRRLEEMDPRESMTLLGTVPLGRIVFTTRALPAVRPARHIVNDGHVIVCTDGEVTIASVKRGTGTVVAYQTDAIDPADNLGWSVTVVGVAHQVTDPAVADAFRRALRHWADDANDQIISISPGVVTGFRLLQDPVAPAGR
jgi:Pyridoxamine 5'-phosphate oxidase